MGANSQGTGTITISPAAAITPDHILHPENRHSPSLVRAAPDQHGMARELVARGMEGDGRHLEHRFLCDIAAAIRALAGRELSGFLEYREDEGTAPACWRAYPVASGAGEYYTVLVWPGPDGAWPPDSAAADIPFQPHDTPEDRPVPAPDRIWAHTAVDNSATVVVREPGPAGGSIMVPVEVFDRFCQEVRAGRFDGPLPHPMDEDFPALENTVDWTELCYPALPGGSPGLLRDLLTHCAEPLGAGFGSHDAGEWNRRALRHIAFALAAVLEGDGENAEDNATHAARYLGRLMKADPGHAPVDGAVHSLALAVLRTARTLVPAGTARLLLGAYEDVLSAMSLPGDGQDAGEMRARLLAGAILRLGPGF